MSPGPRHWLVLGSRRRPRPHPPNGSAERTEAGGAGAVAAPTVTGNFRIGAPAANTLLGIPSVAITIVTATKSRRYIETSSRTEFTHCNDDGSGLQAQSRFWLQTPPPFILFSAERHRSRAELVGASTSADLMTEGRMHQYVRKYKIRIYHSLRRAILLQDGCSAGATTPSSAPAFMATRRWRTFKKRSFASRMIATPHN
jgi:hypothetical protein